MAKGSKIGRNKRKTSNKLYAVEGRLKKNKERKVAKQLKLQRKKKEKALIRKGV